MAKLPFVFAITAAVVLGQPAVAYDFLEKRECTIEFLNRAPVHTTCVVSGRMMARAKRPRANDDDEHARNPYKIGFLACSMMLC